MPLSVSFGALFALTKPRVVSLIVFTAVCLLALNVDALVPDARLAMRQLGSYP